MNHLRSLLPDPSPPAAADQQRRPLPDVEVLLDTTVRVIFNDDDQHIVEETGGREATTAGSSKKKGTAAGSKVPVTGGLVNANSILYGDILDGIEPCLSPPAAGDGGPPGVGFLSLNISWPPEHHLRRGRYCVAYIRGHHKSCFLLCVAARSAQLSGPHTSFNLVYDTLANSVAVVPPDSCYYRRDIASGIALLRCGDCDGGDGGGHFVLAQLRLHNANKGSLLTWRGSLGSGPPSGKWTEEEAVFPLPVDTCTANGDPYCSFHADTEFAVGSTAICWVDLVAGLLIYRIDEREFHFIPLPEDCVTERGDMAPKNYRSMCCIQGQQRQGEILKFASMEGYGQEGVRMAEVTLATWTLVHPLHPEHWTWEKDEASYRIGDLFDDPVYKDELKLQPLPPCYPVISTAKTSVIYLSFIDVKLNYKEHSGELRGVHVLSVDMDSQRVVYAFKGPPGGNPNVIPFNCKSSDTHLQDDSMLESRREEVADDGESRSNPASGVSTGVGDSGVSKLVQRLAGLVIPTPCAPLRRSSKSGPSTPTFCPVGLQCVLDCTQSSNILSYRREEIPIFGEMEIFPSMND